MQPLSTIDDHVGTSGRYHRGAGKATSAPASRKIDPSLNHNSAIKKLPEWVLIALFQIVLASRRWIISVGDLILADVSKKRRCAAIELIFSDAIAKKMHLIRTKLAMLYTRDIWRGSTHREAETSILHITYYYISKSMHRSGF